MANNVIKLKRSETPGAVPAPEDLELGELALNVADGVIFMKLADGSVMEVGNVSPVFDGGTF
ncbi:MAG: hypothetical protein ABT940_11595 [Alphaproteobacteria bacterium]